MEGFLFSLQAEGRAPLTHEYYDKLLAYLLIYAKQNRVVTVEKIEKSDRLDKPINLSGWFPERPYFSATNYLRELEVYNTALDKAQQELGRYDLHSR